MTFFSAEGTLDTTTGLAQINKVCTDPLLGVTFQPKLVFFGLEQDGNQPGTGQFSSGTGVGVYYSRGWALSNAKQHASRSRGRKP